MMMVLKARALDMEAEKRLVNEINPVKVKHLEYTVQNIGLQRI
jgi:hypothetical protein